MAGPYEEKLDQATNAQPVVIMQAADTWKQAADGLGLVADQIDAAKQSIAASWKGGDADAATAAFSSLSGNVRTNQSKMVQASTSLDTAAQTLMDAQGAYNTLPAPGVMPSPVGPGLDGQAQHEAQIQHSKEVDSAAAQDLAREAAAKAAYVDLEGGLGDAQITMNAVAPPRYSGDAAGNGSDPLAPTAGPTSGSYAALPGSIGGAPVGPYSTSTNGTHVHVGVILGPTDGGGVLPHPAHIQPIDETGFGPGYQGTTADGLVDGTIAGIAGGGGPALGTHGGLGGAPGVIGGGSTGSLAGSAVGGLAGMLGGAGGALGALRGGASSTGSSVAGRLGGRLGGLTAGASGSTTSAIGATARGAVLGATKGGVLGAPGTPAATGTTGGTGRTSATAGGTGRTSATAGRGASGAAGRPGSMMPGSGSSAGRAGSAGPGSRGASGRYASAAAEEEAVGGRGGRSSTGMRPGGRGRAATEGAAGRGGAGGTGGSTGQGRDDRAAKRKPLVFEDEDAWLDEDESGPDVIR